MSIILIVDDDSTARETAVAMLEGEGYQIEQATDGLQALAMLKTLQPDLILLDVMMPGMTGFDLCHRIRSTPEVAEVPILMLTALDDRDSLLHGIESGADDFISKPADRYELAARVRTITRLNRYRKLVEQRESLRQMAERVVGAQEQERQRISRELHDDLGQALTTHMLSLRDLQSDLTLPVEVLFEKMQALYDQSYEIAIKVRRIARDLRPPVLDTLGLNVAMQSYCAEFTRRTRLPVELVIDPSIPTLPDVYNITLYRALQEALNNIAKHAQAGQAWVELSAEDSTLSLTIQDNGRGIEDEELLTNGIGLSGLRERLTIAGGKLHITSSSNHGTILTAELPLPENQRTGSLV